MCMPTSLRTLTTRSWKHVTNWNEGRDELECWTPVGEKLGRTSFCHTLWNLRIPLSQRTKISVCTLKILQSEQWPGVTHTCSIIWPVSQLYSRKLGEWWLWVDITDWGLLASITCLFCSTQNLVAVASLVFFLCYKGFWVFVLFFFKLPLPNAVTSVLSECRWLSPFNTIYKLFHVKTVER